MVLSATIHPLSDAKDLDEGRRVLMLESEALKNLSDSLNNSFSHAVESILSLKGRLIVTGMGKSGHIARKIAATLASTGTPAFYVHPAEASHGDLGMVTTDDGILALSNSGETRELIDVIGYSQRHGLPLISITQKGNSSLAQDSDICLVLPQVPEACPNGLAPTTSTTMMLGLGDALALTLLHRKGFSKEDYKAIHPGGNLGHRLKRIKDIMHVHDEVPLIGIESSMEEALLVMTTKSFGCVGIVDTSTKLVGIITDGDLRRHMSQNLLTKKVTDIMTHNPQTIDPYAMVEEALHLMEGRITSLFVVDESQVPIGFIRLHDLLKIGIL